LRGCQGDVFLSLSLAESGGCVLMAVFGSHTNKNYRLPFSFLSFLSNTTRVAASAASVSYEYLHSRKPYTSTPNVETILKRASIAYCQDLSLFSNRGSMQ